MWEDQRELIAGQYILYYPLHRVLPTKVVFSYPFEPLFDT